MHEPQQPANPAGLKLIKLITALIGVACCTVGGATSVAALKHGTSLGWPILTLVIGFALIQHATKHSRH
ncbi:hypothetical protein ACFQ5J_07765 [Lacticaseibacillus baoqingensis]|uniref:Uncharacterized protein n=1 Tax=Lacticaseibacillus baoqingensis TaxID=2486013 RepID=A0ABW4E810_9LACO|nr:hypothetical protein [Lacticaseibacillus baoqingensis]